LQRPGQVPSDQAKSVLTTSENPQLLAAVPVGGQRGFYNQENLFAPRVGFSWAPIDDKTVIRGGFGIFYDHPQGNVLGGNLSSQGFVPWTQTTNIAGVDQSLASFDSAPVGGALPPPSTLAVGGVNPKLVVTRAYDYSLGIQRQLPQSMLLQISYVGNLGQHILRGGNTTSNINQPTWTQQGFVPVSPNPNTYACPPGINAAAYHCSAAGFAPAALGADQIRPYLGYSNLGMALSDVNSNYNSLQASLVKRVGFVSASVSYTFSKTMGYSGGVGDTYNENPEPECPFTCLVSTAANPVVVTGGAANGIGGTQTGGVVESWKQFNYGKVSFDATHIVATAFTVESPFGKRLTGVEGAVAKGWSLSAIMHYQSGSPFTATNSAKIGNSGIATFVRRANFVPNQPVGFSGTCPTHNAVCWVNPAAFAPESTLGAGDAPTNNIIGPAFYQWDLSLRKVFGLHREGTSLQFRVDAFNAFNQTNWNGTSGFTLNNVTSSSFGQITTAFPARILQFGGKISF